MNWGLCTDPNLLSKHSRGSNKMPQVQNWTGTWKTIISDPKMPLQGLKIWEYKKTVEINNKGISILNQSYFIPFLVPWNFQTSNLHILIWNDRFLSPCPILYLGHFIGPSWMFREQIWICTQPLVQNKNLAFKQPFRSLYCL